MVLIGKHGTVLEKNGKGVVTFTSPKLIMKYGSSLVFPLSELAKWLSVIEVTHTAGGAIRISTWPGTE